MWNVSVVARLNPIIITMDDLEAFLSRIDDAQTFGLTGRVFGALSCRPAGSVNTVLVIRAVEVVPAFGPGLLVVTTTGKKEHRHHHAKKLDCFHDITLSIRLWYFERRPSLVIPQESYL